MAAENTDQGPLIETFDQVEKGFNDAFGDEFNANEIDLTPQGYTGREIPIIARSVVQLQNLSVETIEAYDLNSAQGRSLDSIGATLNESRNGATNSKISAQLTGVPGVLVGDKRVRYRFNGTLWRTPALDSLDNPLAIGANGLLAVTLTAADKGPVDAFQATTAQWTIVDAVIGWASVESTSDATLGEPREADPAYRERLRLAGRSSGVATEPGVQRSTLGVPGVISIRLLNNRESFPVDGVPGKSSEMVVDGGDPQVVGQTLLDVYGGTDGFTGTLEITAFDFLGNARLVRFTPVALVDVVIFVTVDTTGSEAALPDDAESTMISVVAARVNGGGEGVDVVPDDLEGQVRAAFEAGTIPENGVTVAIGLKGGPVAAESPFAINDRQKARTLPTVQAGQVIGTETQTFVFAVTWTLELAVDGGTPQTISFSINDFPNTGAATALEIANAINSQLVGAVAGSQLGAVTITSNTLGEGSEVEIRVGSSAGLLTELGFSVGDFGGSDGDVSITIL